MAKVLIVDDTMMIGRLYSQWLKQQGHNPITARHGEAALDYIADHPVDLVITDLEMPIMDGFTLCETLRSHPQHNNIPIVVLSAQTAKENRQRAFKAGADEYLIKPVNLRQLVATIETYLESPAAAS